MPISSTLNLSNLWRQTAAIWPVAVPTSLTWHDIGAILHVIQAAQIGLVVEIGVDQGGLSALLLSYREHTPCWGATPPLDYLGIDINLATMCRSLFDKHHAHFIEGDAWAPETIALVQSRLTSAPRALIFCDGGNKPRDIRTYGPLLRPGDLLLAHDYHNEYGDEALIDLPAGLERLTPNWLDETLLCMFEKR